MERLMRFDRLAEMFEYPRQDLAGNLNPQPALEALFPAPVAPHLYSYCSEIGDHTLDTRQEMFVRTFDFNPDCALEIGWHLFGEDYKRGELLAFLRRELRLAGVEQGNELPDHLGNILRLLGRWNSEDDATEFVRLFVMPALVKLEKAIPQTETPYPHLIRAVKAACAAEFGIAEEPDEAERHPPTRARRGGFTRSGAIP
jgi:nitrate reductase delta subunit